MSGKGSGRRKGANDALYLKNNPFPSLLERRKAERAQSSTQTAETAESVPEREPGEGTTLKA